jgi:FAD/FMN-containing dehydrogenase
MATVQLFAVANFTAFILFIFLFRCLRIRSSSTRRDAGSEKVPHLDLEASFTEPARQLRAKLIAALPDSVVTPENAARFTESVKQYWAQQACEAVPSCVVRPRDVEELSQAIKILKSEFDQRTASQNCDSELFAIRSGGHSPVAGASSIRGGALIDLSLFGEVTISHDEKSVTIGSGCKWGDFYKTLELRGLTVAGGRNAAVGVGGLTLGGGLSFFSPRFGFVCSNIIAYEVVLADGLVVNVSATSHPDLWRALKGGANNFCVVSRFTIRAFPSSKIWSGFLYLHPSQAPNVLSSFEEYLDRTTTGDEGQIYDEFAAGPIACFTYLQQLGIQAIAVALTHTKLAESSKSWPRCWQTSGFAKLWRFWSTCSVKSLAAASDEMSVLNPPGRRQKFATTTIKNDRATLAAAHEAYRDAIGEIRKHNIKNMSWTLVLQPMLPEWARKGDSNVLGLSNCDSALVNISFTLNWELSQDDSTAQRITRAAIEQIDAFTEYHNTGHRFRYINYCGSWQQPFDGYGWDNLEFMRGVSRRYDAEGLFQKGCAGGFKLGR